MLSKAVALVLGILSFVPPFSGLLRFYLKQPVAGVLYTLTAGGFFIGNILDVVQIPHLVKKANMRIKRREMRLDGDIDVLLSEERQLEHQGRAASIEMHILRSAKENGGLTTPSEVALAAGVRVEEAQRSLDYLATKGFAEIKVSKSGVIAYQFADILKPGNQETYDDL